MFQISILSKKFFFFSTIIYLQQNQIYQLYFFLSTINFLQHNQLFLTLFYLTMN